MPYGTEGYGFDLVEILCYMFVLFFFSLIIYLRREDHREGYPLEEDTTGRLENDATGIFYGAPKTFKMADGHVITKPDGVRDTRELAAKRTAVWPGAPIEPVGNPLGAGIGPGAYQLRSTEPDRTVHGDAKIVPLRVATSFSVVRGDPALIGYTVKGMDGAVAGTVSDIWVDTAESLIRYLEVALADGSRTVILPMMMSAVSKGRRTVQTDSITGAQFAGVPALSNPDQISLREEDIISGYYGGGYMYATPVRAEPLA
jgi:photosynthetic reaction center H subunit